MLLPLWSFGIKRTRSTAWKSKEIRRTHVSDVTNVRQMSSALSLVQAVSFIKIRYVNYDTQELKHVFPKYSVTPYRQVHNLFKNSKSWTPVNTGTWNENGSRFRILSKREKREPGRRLFVWRGWQIIHLIRKQASPWLAVSDTVSERKHVMVICGLTGE